jgi:hypothetical protein
MTNIHSFSRRAFAPEFRQTTLRVPGAARHEMMRC